MSETRSPSFSERVRTYVDENGGQRLLLAGLLLVLIQAFFLFDWVLTATSDRRVELQALKSDVTRMQALSQLDGLDATLAAHQQSLQAYRARAFKADTAGLAAAQIRSVLQDSIERVGLDRVQMTVNIEDGQDSDVVTFLVDLDAQEVESGDFAVFIAELSKQERAFYISRLEYTIRGRRVSMRLETLAEIGEDA